MTMITDLQQLATPAPIPEDRAADRPSGSVAVDVVVPVYNEETDLGPSVRRLHDYLATRFPVTSRITIADNASTDSTPQVAAALAAELPGVRVVRMEQKGRGRALSRTWLDNDAAVVAYMDVDLSTDLAALLPLVAPLLTGHSDIAIGSRLSRTSRVVRGPKREFISRSYNLLLRTLMQARFSDAQCGFKAMRADRARMLLPHVRDTGWFWDTELLVIAERVGLRIHEVPVDWVDDPNSTVDIVATARADLQGMWRIARGMANGTIPMADLRRAVAGADATPVAEGVPVGLPRQLGSFAVIGVFSTLAYALLYLLLRPLGAQAANFLALLITAVANTAANRYFTFGTKGRDRAVRHQAEGLVVFAIGLAVSSGTLAAVHAASPQPPTWLELGSLVVANLVATVIRFVLLKSWVFHPGRGAAGRPQGGMQ